MCTIKYYGTPGFLCYHKETEVLILKIYETLNIDKNSDDPMYMQIYEGIKRLIENDTLKSDEKLPPIRNLAQKLNVNNITIVNAYKMLESKGYVYTKVGSGTYVKSSRQESKVYSDEVDMMGQGYIKIDNNSINFSTSTPSPALFPVSDFKEIFNEVLDRDGGYAFEYQESKGYLPLRESVCEYIRRQGIDCNLKDMHILSGAQQGIDVVAKALIRFNDTIIVESPTYTGAIAAFKSRGANIIEIPMMDDGIDIKELENALKTSSPKLIYVMTNFQNPTGVSYSAEKKQNILYLAAKYNTYILEDDYLSELKFYGDMVKPLKSMDIDNRVIYLKSFSKIFMPGIRLAFMAVPHDISGLLLSAKRTSDISTSSLMQRAFDLYLRNKKWETQLKSMRDIYKSRYDETVKVLRQKAPFIEFKEPGGGIHIWAKTDISSSELSSSAKLKGVLLAPGNVFYIDGRKSNYFRLSFAGVEKNNIEKGIELIADAYESLKSMNPERILPFL